MIEDADCCFARSSFWTKAFSNAMRSSHVGQRMVGIVSGCEK
jgi:hypothetical protein